MDSFLDSLGAAFSSIHLSIFLIGFTSNTILLSAAVLHTPANLKSYSTLLKFGTVNDLICVFCDFINMQRILVVPGNLLYISYGPCTRISVRLCYLVHCLQIGTIVYSYYVMLASFIFRLWILLRPTPRSSTVFSIMIAIAIPPALVLMCILLNIFAIMFHGWFTSAQADNGFVKRYIQVNAPRYLNEKGALSGNFGMTAQLIITCIFTIAPVVPIYICIIIVRQMKRKKTTHTYCQILSNLSASMTNISTRNRNLHRILVKVVQFSKRGKIQQNNKALTIHACLPLLSSFAVLIYLIRLFDIYYHPSLEKAITTLASVPPALGAFCSLYYIEPYRRYISFHYS
uniref:G protein-coupled receptor n=1 Tax=Pristionchus pacificus TaxID=54126 RepID=A0A8R1UUU5_PRIPA